MKHIRGFNEELNWQIYDKAARKLKTLGHTDRSDQMDAWNAIKTHYQLGHFNFAANIVEHDMTHWKTKAVTKVPIIAEDTTKEKILIPGPVPAYLSYCTTFDIDEYLSSYTEEGDELDICMLFAFFAADIEKPSNKIKILYNDRFGSFQIGVKAHIQDGEIKIKERSAYLEQGHGAGDFEGLLKFSDRKSAMKFKQLIHPNKIGEIWDEMKDGRKVFMERSTEVEWLKLLNEIHSIPISQLYKQMS